MKSIEVIGKTVEEAIEKAVAELGIPQEKLQIDVIEEPNKGLFGFIGKKECRIRVTEIEDTKAQECAEKFLKGIFELSEVDYEMATSKDENGTLHVDISGEEASLFIGRRGDTLDALQMLVNLTVNKEVEEYQRVMLDIENYREKREESLTNYVKKMARQVARQRRIAKLDPMNPYERRIAHSVLQDDPYVTTYSEGKEPYRRVVITLKRERKTQNVEEIDE